MVISSTKFDDIVRVLENSDLVWGKYSSETTGHKNSAIS